MTNLNVISQVTLSSCEEECSKNAKCVGYTYITSSSRCDLKDESGIGGGLKKIKGLGLISGLREKVGKLESSPNTEKGNDLHKGLFRTKNFISKVRDLQQIQLYQKSPIHNKSIF